MRAVVSCNRLARADISRLHAAPLQTNIDLDLQRFVAELFGDSLQGGAVAIDPKTGGVLALYSAPAFDPNRFIGGIPKAYCDSLRSDPRQPLYNKALQGAYPPASTWKLATAIIGLERGVVALDDRMPQPCTGGYVLWSLFPRAGRRRATAPSTLRQAIAKSCDVYFYQLGLQIGLARLVAGGVKLAVPRADGHRPARGIALRSGRYAPRLLQPEVWAAGAGIRRSC